jgi:hypothetical protein
MGACCVKEFNDDKISSACSIYDLILDMSEKKKEAAEEIQNIYDFLANPYPEHPFSVFFIKLTL